jgi:hypothetical protein
MGVKARCVCGIVMLSCRCPKEHGHVDIVSPCVHIVEPPKHSILITHRWCDGPQIAVQVWENGEWIPYAKSSLDELIYNMFVDEDARDWPEGLYKYVDNNFVMVV